MPEDRNCFRSSGCQGGWGAQSLAVVGLASPAAQLVELCTAIRYDVAGSVDAPCRASGAGNATAGVVSLPR
jgi:hypothetical protein